VKKPIGRPRKHALGGLKLEVGVLDRRRRVRSNVLQLHRVVALYLWSRKPDWARDTYENYKIHLRRVCEVMGPVKLPDIDWPCIKDFVAARRRQGISNASITAEYRALVSVLEWCFAQQIISEVPTRKMRLSDFGLPPRHIPRRAKALTDIVRQHKAVLASRIRRVA